jgi:uncharacterized OB-fold protein
MNADTNSVQGQVDLDPSLFRVSADGSCALVGGKCSHCGTITWGVRPMCPQCWAEGAQSEVAIGRTGTLYSATVVRRSPSGFTPPYTMGVIDTEEGVRIIGRLVMKVDADWQKDTPVVLEAGPLGVNEDGAEVIGPMFRVVMERVAR